MQTEADKSLTEPALQHAHHHFTLLHQDLTIARALDEIRAHGAAERIIYFYVVNDDKKLVGVLPTRRLLGSPLETPLKNIMVGRVLALPAEATLLDACETFVMYRFLALPIVDAERRVLGVVEANVLTEELTMAADELEDRAKHDEIFESLGLHLDTAARKGLWHTYRRRLPWLSATLTSGMAMALLCHRYALTLSKTLVLVFFMSLITGLGESVGTQSVALTLHRLRHAGAPTAYLQNLFQELKVAVYLGLPCGALVGAIVRIWHGSVTASTVIGVTIALALGGACFWGTSVPTILHKFKLDARIAATPVTLALTDITTLAIYLNLARWWLG